MLRHLLSCLPALATLLILSSPARSENEPPPPPSPPPVRPSIDAAVAGLPSDLGRGLEIEAALLVADFKSLLAWQDHRKAVQSQTKAGAAYHQSTFTVGGVDISGELRKWVQWAAPGREAVPGGLTAYTMAPGAGVQLFMKVQPGFLQRVQAGLQPGQPGWARTVEGDRITAKVLGVELMGRVDQEGWLRLSVAPDMLVGAAPQAEPLFSPAMGQRMALLETVLFVRGGGVGSVLLGALLSQWNLQGLVADTRTIALGWRWDGDKTSEIQLLLDNPELERLAEELQLPAPQDELITTWDSDVTQFFSVAIPPALKGQLLAQVLGALEAAVPMKPELKQALHSFEGRVGIAMFGSPGDWAVGLQFGEAVQAQNMLPELHAYLTAVGAKSGVRFRSAQLEPFVGVPGPIWRQRPNAQLDGLRVAQLGRTLLIVNQRNRLEKLVAQQPSQGAATSYARFLTPMVAKRLRQPALLQGYMVMGNDGSLVDLLALFTGLFVDGWDLMVRDAPELAEYEPMIRQLPTLLTLEGFSLALAYDAAVTADLLDGIFSLQLLTSEI